MTLEEKVEESFRKEKLASARELIKFLQKFEPGTRISLFVEDNPLNYIEINYTKNQLILKRVFKD